MRSIIIFVNRCLNWFLNVVTRHDVVIRLYYHGQRCRRETLGAMDAPAVKMAGVLMLAGLLVGMAGITLATFRNGASGNCFMGSLVMYTIGRVWLRCIEFMHQTCPADQ